MQFRNYPERITQFIASMPFIYGMLIPLVFLDISIEIYHQICFRLYNIPLVNRSKYIRIDRQHLSYLSTIEKINCMYCGYANGLLHYASKIAGETENYWCSIKHQHKNGFVEPPHHSSFAQYGNKQDLEEKISG